VSSEVRWGGVGWGNPETPAGWHAAPRCMARAFSAGRKEGSAGPAAAAAAPSPSFLQLQAQSMWPPGSKILPVVWAPGLCKQNSKPQPSCCPLTLSVWVGGVGGGGVVAGGGAHGACTAPRATAQATQQNEANRSSVYFGNGGVQSVPQRCMWPQQVQRAGSTGKQPHPIQHSQASATQHS
jgi:hypothetical protein